MKELLFFAFEVNLYLTVIILIYEFGFKKNGHYSFSRKYLLTGIVLSFLLPLVKVESIILPNSNLIIFSYIDPVSIDINSIQYQSFRLPQFLFALYLLISLLFLTKMLWGFNALISIRKKSKKENGIYIIPNSSAAFSFFRWIFIGDRISDSDQRLIIQHEKIHGSKYHSMDIVICHVLEMLFWFNPLLFLLKRRFNELHEYEADDNITTETSSYIELLLKQKFESLNTNFIHQFNSNHLKNRIMKIKQNSPSRINLKPLFPLAFCLALVFIANQHLNSMDFTIKSNGSKTADNINKVEALRKFINEGLEKQAQFPGGQKALIEFIGKNIKYPAEAKKSSQEGVVYVEFIVDQKGNCKDFKVKRGVNEILDAAAIKALKKMPKWEPAVKDGKKVPSSLTLPVKYQLS